MVRRETVNCGDQEVIRGRILDPFGRVDFFYFVVVETIIVLFVLAIIYGGHCACYKFYVCVYAASLSLTHCASSHVRTTADEILFLVACNITGRLLQPSHETFTVDRQSHWYDAVKFARRQHPAMGSGTKFDVPCTTRTNCFRCR